MSGRRAIAGAAGLAAALTLAAACAYAAMGYLATGGAPDEPAVHTVVIDATRFSPAVLHVRAGDTIVWRNDDMFPHTATSRDGGFDSGSIAPGSSWRHTVGAGTGTTSYVCTYHPTMKGVLEVAAPQ